MVSCAVCKCTKTKKTNERKITFHKFPLDEKRRRKWVEFIDKSNWINSYSNPNLTFYMCSQHFKENCFIRTSSKVVLMKHAVPTIKEVDYVKTRITYEERLSLLKSDEDAPVPIGIEPIVSITEEESHIAGIDVPMEAAIPAVSGAAVPSIPDLRGSVLPGSTSIIGRTLFVHPNSVPKKKFDNLQKKHLKVKAKFRALQKKMYKQTQKMLKLESLLNNIKLKQLGDEYERLLLDEFQENKELISRLLEKSKGKSTLTKYSPSVRNFAITLNFFSPKAYNYLRKKFQNCLPHVKTLSKWDNSVEDEEGSSSESFDSMNKQVTEENN